MQKKDQKNYWPHFIIGLVFFAIGMGIWTITTAIENPVELDNSYMMNYHQLDKDINKIIESGKKFDKKYRFKLITKTLKEGENTLLIEVSDKKGNIIQNANIDILVTRPETTKFDKKLKASFKDGKYIAKVKLEKKGRWNIIVRVKIDKLEKFQTYKLHT